MRTEGGKGGGRGGSSDNNMGGGGGGGKGKGGLEALSLPMEGSVFKVVDAKVEEEEEEEEAR